MYEPSWTVVTRIDYCCTQKNKIVETGTLLFYLRIIHITLHPLSTSKMCL